MNISLGLRFEILQYNIKYHWVLTTCLNVANQFLRKKLVSRLHQSDLNNLNDNLFQDTTFLKKQVEIERERQIQWKELYFKAHMELMELKKRNQTFKGNVSSPSS